MRLISEKRAWSRLQEELLHCLVTPMQKHCRQPSGFPPDRWKKPALHSSHRAPATLFWAGEKSKAHELRLSPAISATEWRKKKKEKRIQIVLMYLLISSAGRARTLQLHGRLPELLIAPLLSHWELSVVEKRMTYVKGWRKVHLGGFQPSHIPEL